MNAYIKSLRAVFAKLHHCEVIYVKTVLVKETFQGQIVWEGNVEVFDLKGHPTALRGYAWGHDKANGSQAITVLGVPPINSPLCAVKAAIASELRDKLRN